LHCDVALAVIVEGAHAGETDEIAEDADDDVEVDVGWLPPHALRQRRTEDTTNPHAS